MRILDKAEARKWLASLEYQAREHPNEAAALLPGEAGRELQISHVELRDRARDVAGLLRVRGVRADDKVVTLFNPGVDFLCALLGTLYAEAIPVPLLPPDQSRSLARLQLLMTSAGISQVLTTREDLSRLRVMDDGTHSATWARWFSIDDRSASQWSVQEPPEAEPGVLDQQALAEVWAQLARPESDAEMAVALGAELFPLSSTQEVVWLDQTLLPSTPLYNVGVGWRAQGKIDPRVFEQAINLAANTNDALRILLCEDRGRALQHVLSRVEITVPVVDLTGEPDADERARAYMQRRLATLFALYEGLLWTSELIRVSDSCSYWLLRCHHLVADGFSIALILHAVADAYNALMNAAGVAPPRPSYLEFVREDQRYLESERYSRDRRFWSERYAQLPESFIVRAGVDLVGAAASSRRVCWTMQRAEYQRLSAFAVEHGASFSNLMLAALSAYFARTAGLDQIVIGVPVHNRGSARNKQTIGMFSSVCPIGIHVGPNAPFAALMREVAAEFRRCYRHQRLPLTEINWSVKIARLGRQQLFDIVLSSMSFDGDDVFGDAPTKVIPLHSGIERTPLVINVRDHHAGDDVLIELIYNTGAFEQSQIEQIRDSIAVILETAVQNADAPVFSLPMMSEAMRRRVLHEFNATRVEYARDKLIHELFEEQVARDAQATAVVYEDERLSYGELNRRANQLARYLRGRGVGLDERVGLCVERSVEMVVGLLGILKAGAAYVPLDPSYPGERLEYMLRDATPRVLLTQQRLRASMPATSAEVVTLDEQWEEIAAQSDANLAAGELGLTPAHLAYVIYTSGSTGAPKGVMVEQGSVVNLLSSMQRQPGINASDRLLALTTLSFDIAGLEIYLPLISGAQVVIASREVAADATRLAAMIKQSGVTVLQATPATWRLLLSVDWPGQSSLKALCGGEALSVELSQQIESRVEELWNLYGPTETTIWSCARQVRKAQGASHGTEMIGRPIANTQMYVLDSHRQPVPIGVAGEIYIGGAGVARGYLNLPELTAARFMRDPFSADPAARMYKTGDRGRWQADGNIEYLGRNDDQVKIRGFRIELGEIEARLSQCAGVKEAVVLAREDEPGEKTLVAYVTAQDGAELSAAQLRSELSSVLVDYMVPSAFMVLEALPLTPNGKLDRQALPKPDQFSMVTRKYAAPVGDMEATLASLWQELLHVERVGRHDNFFELGGHSLLAVQLVARIREQCHVEGTLNDLFENPFLFKLAERVIELQLASFMDQDVEKMKTELNSLSERELLDLMNSESELDELPNDMPTLIHPKAAQ